MYKIKGYLPHSKTTVTFRELAIREFDHLQIIKQAKTGFKLIFDGLGIRGFRNVTPRIERKTSILNLFFPLERKKLHVTLICDVIQG